MDRFADAYGSAALAALGFFWKAGWAFVLGYAISAMIQAFVPKKSLTRRMGGTGPASIGLATGFGAISSSCSFAALAAARSLIAKGASIVAGIAFMFASTNLVIELGILIFIFLGGPYLAAELLGGLVLILISSALVRWTAPKSLRDEMRRAAEGSAPDEQDDFDWRERMLSLAGWRRVGHRFVAEWRMVWEEIVIGFTVAGGVATLVPDVWWQTLFLTDTSLPTWVVSLENAVVAPLVASTTFIGSMGNIPLATVLASSGAAFAGVMAFIYSDLMIPPLVRINASYYGAKGALYIAAVMFGSIVATALLLDATTWGLGIEIGGARMVARGNPFEIDYTLGLDVAFVVIAAGLVWLHRGHVSSTRDEGTGDDTGSDSSWGPKRVAALTCVALVIGGLVVRAVTS